jgi:MazG family protein
LRGIVARLRAPGGCPWDREQTHASLRGALIEETYEVLAAIEANDHANLCEELGDLLLHVVMHAQMANEAGAFDFDDVARGIGDKMIRRHPHVFGDERASDSAAVLLKWDEIKRREKSASSDESLLANLPAALPALARAQKAQTKASKVGFDWPNVAQVLLKVREEIDEVSEAMEESGADAADRVADEIGDLLYSAVNLARWHHLEAELVLQRATDKFVRRFQRMEVDLQARGLRWSDATFEELDALWERVKHIPPGKGLPPGINEHPGAQRV